MVVIPAHAGIQYAEASRLNHNRLWNTGSPVFAGDDSSTVEKALSSCQPSSISPEISWVRFTLPTVITILAGSFSWPLRRPLVTASRIAFSISRWEVMPTFFRKPRRLPLKTSSFMNGSSKILRSGRIVQHLLGEISLGTVGAGAVIAALDVAVLAAVDVFVLADCDIVCAAGGGVIGRRVDHDL